MGNSWQTQSQRDFFDKHLTSYNCSSGEGNLKDTFWPRVIKEWFELWPLSEPPSELVEKEGTLEKARKAWRGKKIEQVKRVFKSKGDECTVGNRRNLHLEDGVPRKRSELQMYMILYYDSRIRKAVVKSWAKDRVPNLESRVEVNIPDDEIESYESFSLRDPKIPISYKKAIAQRLYNAESDVIKAEVRLQRESWYENGKTIRTKNEDDRKALVREYERNIPALSRNIGNVLRNAERKCAAKGITWLACPAPSKGGKPVAYFQCAGNTPEGKDFETFIGKEKAVELRALFSSWIHAIYPPSEWHLYSINGSIPGDTSLGPIQEEDDEMNVDSDTQQPDPPATPVPTSTAPSEVSVMLPEPTAAHPALSSGTNAVTSSPPSLDQSVLDIEAPTDPNPSVGNDSLTTIDKLPTNAVGSVWMKSKKTLKYFDGVHKVGKLSDLILHWYQLESALGFPETTPKGFPLKSRPQVLPVFFKNGHNYTKGYGLEAKSLGADIMRWWEEITTTDGATNICFGGPTGIYNFVVLMSWWSSLLKGRPDDELVDFLRTLEDIDRAISSAVRDTDRPITGPSCGGSLETPTISQACQPRGSKRAIPEETSSRKCLRSGQA